MDSMKSRPRLLQSKPHCKPPQSKIRTFIIFACALFFVLNGATLRSIMVIASKQYDHQRLLSVLKAKIDANVLTQNEPNYLLNRATRKQLYDDRVRMRGVVDVSVDYEGLYNTVNEVFAQSFPPRNSTDNLVVLLGVGFIVDRDGPLWNKTFSSLGFQVARSTKKRVAKGRNSQWIVLKCLDLLDGVSHCIETPELLKLSRKRRVSRITGLRRTLWDKDSFCETLSDALKGFKTPAYKEFVFPCWILPRESKALYMAASSRYSEEKFILKPSNRGEGNGIVVVDSPNKLKMWRKNFHKDETVVAQTYLANPLLVNRRKWDLRTYVLVTSVSPLRAYLFNDGLVRFAGGEYDKNATASGNKTQFLTNTSINKKKGIAVDDLTWTFETLDQWLEENGIEPAALWSGVEEAIAQLLLSAEPQFVKHFEHLQSGFRCSSCYQLLGVDIIVDENIVPRVIEVNGEPSMLLTGENNSHYDRTKKQMSHDLIRLLLGQNKVIPARLAEDMLELQLLGDTFGFSWKGDCGDGNNVVDYCLSRRDIEFLLEMKREESLMGGFRRVYPSKFGGEYSRLIRHLSAAFASTKVQDISATYNIHNLLTRLAKVSKAPHPKTLSSNS